MKKAPTLLDAAIRETFRGNKHMPASARPALMAARKFVLDYAMSEFLADLANAAFTNLKGNPKLWDVLDGARCLARLPYHTTWIEYDAVARRRRTIEAYNETTVPTSSGQFATENEVCPRIGWLLETHPANPTVLRMTEVSELENNIPVMMPFSYIWNVDNESMGFKQIDHQFGPEIASAMTGIGGCRSTNIALGVSYNMLNDKTMLGLLLMETAGELRAAWTLLAALGNLPITHKQVRPPHGYFAKGRYRPFMEHNVISLNIPAGETTKKLARQSIEIMRRKRHSVRGHWRPKLANFPRCEHNDGFHVWEFDAEHGWCSHCQRRSAWVAEHERGDASLGYVQHEYNVKHKVS